MEVDGSTEGCGCRHQRPIGCGVSPDLAGKMRGRLAATLKWVNLRSIAAIVVMARKRKNTTYIIVWVFLDHLIFCSCHPCLSPFFVTNSELEIKARKRFKLFITRFICINIKIPWGRLEGKTVFKLTKPNLLLDWWCIGKDKRRWFKTESLQNIRKIRLVRNWHRGDNLWNG